MKPLRLLCTSLFASAFALPASAQTLILHAPPAPIPTTPRTFIFQGAPQTFPAAPLFTTPLSPPITILNGTQQPLTLFAQNNAPCYTLRSYGFTAKDLQSPNPHSSTFTECSPASTVSRKAIQIIPAETVTMLQPIPTK